MNQPATSRGAKRHKVIVGRAARLGLPAFEQEDEETYSAFGAELSTTVLLSRCGQCGRVFPDASAATLACGCGLLLCASCATRACEICQMPGCQFCVVQVGSNVLCKRHAQRQGLTAAALLVAALGLSAYLVRLLMAM